MSESNEPTRLQAELITYGNAPGYRDASITVEIFDRCEHRRLELVLSAEATESLCREFLRNHSLAWHGHRPLDAKPHEQKRPGWVPEWSPTTGQ